MSKRLRSSPIVLRYRQRYRQGLFCYSSALIFFDRLIKNTIRCGEIMLQDLNRLLFYWITTSRMAVGLISWKAEQNRLSRCGFLSPTPGLSFAFILLKE